MILKIKIDRLTLHPDLQMREVMDQALIYSYVQLMKEGAVFDPMSATFDGDTYWLDGGHHRYQAYKLLNVREVAVDYTDGDFDEAFRKALRSNHKNGKQRSNDDKRKAVLKCFLRYPDMSNYEVAKAVEVSQSFVAGIRDPEVKARQDEARERSVGKKLGQKPDTTTSPTSSENTTDDDCGKKTTNPISSLKTTLEENQALGVAPSDEEMEAAAAAMEANEAAWMKFLEADDKLAEAFEEIKNLNLLVAQLKLRMNGLMNEKNLAIKIIKELEADKKSLMKKLKKTV
jgi:cbb3-type cytochrome oxidase cytochrome c subunit